MCNSCKNLEPTSYIFTDTADNSKKNARVYAQILHHILIKLKLTNLNV